MNQIRSMWVILAVSTLWANNAYAYLDPASGSLLVQGVVGAIAATALVIRSYWHKLKGLFARILSRSTEPQGSGD